MQEQIRKKMLSDYENLSYKRSETCVKYKYDINGVTVNLYFDAYDPKSNVLTMILSTERKFYFTTLNVMNTHIRKEYLPSMPYVFLKKILVDNELDTFFSYMEEEILEISPIPASYKKEVIFVNTIRYQKNNIELPFWWHMRKARMTDNMLEVLSERADITRDILLKIQRSGYTLVRTGDVNKRRQLTLILDECGIVI